MRSSVRGKIGSRNTTRLRGSTLASSSLCPTRYVRLYPTSVLNLQLQPPIRYIVLCPTLSGARSLVHAGKSLKNARLSWGTIVTPFTGVIDRSPVAFVERNRERHHLTIRVKCRIASQICLMAITKICRSLMTDIRIIIFIFEGHIEKHESVSLFLQNEARKFKCTKDKLTTSSYSLANYGVVL